MSTILLGIFFVLFSISFLCLRIINNSKNNNNTTKIQVHPLNNRRICMLIIDIHKESRRNDRERTN